MAVRAGNTYCDVCSKPIYGKPEWVRTIGNDGYILCSLPCARAFDAEYKIVANHSQKQVGKNAQVGSVEEERKGADEQRGWKMHRFWNQAYKRKKDVWEQKKVEREFKAIQRKARRGG